MDKILVSCNHKPLVGKIRINGSKNAILPIMAASLLTDSLVTLYNVPDLIDVHMMSELIRNLGAKVNFQRNDNFKANHTLEIGCSHIDKRLASKQVAITFRASFLVVGPMLSRFGEIQTFFPGGCSIGDRPVDMHIKALEKMGATINIDGCTVAASTRGKLQSKDITFERVSVGATENIIMAATLAEGVTIINNAAMEPEILDLIKFLKSMGARIEVNDTRITIEGVEVLNGCAHKTIPDRVEAGTYALAALMTDGELKLEGVKLSDVRCMSNELKSMGAKIKVHDDGISISRQNFSIKSIHVATNPYPNFPTDMQPQIMSAMCIADGISIIEENIFENRLSHADELRKLGAHICVDKNKATIEGVKNLYGANVYANDLRSTAGLVLASLVAAGETTINNAHHLWRGYEAMDEKLNSCGANIFVSP